MCLEALHNCSEKELNDIIKLIDIEKYPELYQKYCFMVI